MLLQDLGEKYGRRKITLCSHLIIIIIFSGLYYKFLDSEDFNNDGDNFKNYGDSLYFSIVTHASVGYGDISPKSSRAKMIVSMHIITAFIFIICLYI